MTPTLVTFLLDKSGSMGPIRLPTIEAFNAYLDELKKGDNITFSFLQFDTVSIDTLEKNTPIAQVKALDENRFQPRGGTPLIDACVKTIMAVETAVAKRDDNPKIVVCFQTDGEENASREHTWEELNDLIKAKTGEGWQFNFMGASIDAYVQAAKMGLSAINTVSYDSASPEATRHAFRASGANTAMFASGAAVSTGYSTRQKAASGDKFDDVLKMAAATSIKNKAIVDDIEL